MHGKFTGRYRCCVTATCDDSHGSGRNLFSSTQEKIGDRKKVLRMRGGEEQGKEWKEKEKNSGESYGEYISPRAIGQRYPPYSTFDHNLSLQGCAARKIHPPRWLFDPICPVRVFSFVRDDLRR